MVQELFSLSSVSLPQGFIQGAMHLPTPNGRACFSRYLYVCVAATMRVDAFTLHCTPPPVVKKPRVDHTRAHVACLSPNACCIAVSSGENILLFQAGSFILGLRG